MPSALFSASIPISLSHGRSYDLHFAPRAEVPALMTAAGLRTGRCLVVTDTNVAPLYGAALEQALGHAGWRPRRLTLPAGEATKAYAPLHQIYDTALGWGIDRKTPLIALGGGVVGDLAGYAAATLLRGLPLVQVPTSLIAQVDSAIGGKTGINHAAGKNLIGAFHQPALVCIDYTALATLPVREWTSGLAEVVKHALIADADFFAHLEAQWTAVLDRTTSAVAAVVHRAAGIKAEVVSADERELGRRAVLNFGHTFGHAIERVAGYGRFTHGEAVALGMRAALHLSHHLHPALPLDRADALIRRIPIHHPFPAGAVDALTDAMLTDKKAEAGRLRFVLLRRLGEAYVTDHVTPEAVAAAWAFALDYTPAA